MSETIILNIDDKWFNKIKNKEKRVEMRLNDEKRSKIKINDILSIKNNNTFKIIKAKVVNIKKFKDFFELIRNYNNSDLGFNLDEKIDPSFMYEYYNKEDISRYGVLAIEIELV